MSDIHDGGPAFPKSLSANDGISLRDYIAAKAMVAIGPTIKPSPSASLEDVIAELARVSYLAADAMIAERSKTRAKS